MPYKIIFALPSSAVLNVTFSSILLRPPLYHRKSAIEIRHFERQNKNLHNRSVIGFTIADQIKDPLS